MFDFLHKPMEAVASSCEGDKPCRKAILQNRQQFGVNFGSLFVLEKYMFGDLFIDGTETEFEAISANVKKHGVEETKRKLEDHWNRFVGDEDWDWLSSKNVTAIRIPIGYWHVGFTRGTPFDKIREVYAGAWGVLKQIIDAANARDIGVLVDLHALPKGANAEHHSGVKLSKAGFWGDSHSEDLAIDVLKFLAKELAHCDNIVGYQIVNECVFDNEAKYQKRYYKRAVNEIRKIDPVVPVIISDGWWAQQYADWIASLKHPVGVVIDTHVYRCFSDSDKAKSPQQIISDLQHDVAIPDNVDVMVGEYSCVLDGQTWDKAGGQSRDELVKQYGQAQMATFLGKHAVGSYFWTYKFQYGDGGEWGFRPMCDRGCIPTRRLKHELSHQLDQVLQTELQNHENYWNSQNPREKYEHWRFADGFTTGWNDALCFSELNSSTIGRLNNWKHFRKMQHIQAKGESGFLWEWEHGFACGVSSLQKSLGI